MNFIKLPSNSKKLLDDILQADNPTEMLSSRFDDISAKEDAELRGIIRDLRESGYINVNCADNKPYLVTINNSARTYEEQLAEYEKSPNSVPSSIIIDQSIKIGDGNKIKKSTISHKNNTSDTSQKKSFFEKHPLLCGIIASVLAGVILLFSFWQSIVNWIEGLF